MKNRLSCIFKFSIVSIMAIFFTILLNYNISYAEKEINTSFDPSTCDAHYGKGHCGKNVNWLINSDGTLHVYYEVFSDKNKCYNHLEDGYMENYSHSSDSKSSDPPWEKARDNIKSVVIHTGIKSLGSNAFKNILTLLNVELNSDLNIIKDRVFYGTSITKIILPANIQFIGNQAFYVEDLESVSVPQKRVEELYRRCQIAIKGTQRNGKKTEFMIYTLKEMKWGDCFNIDDIYGVPGGYFENETQEKFYGTSTNISKPNSNDLVNIKFSFDNLSTGIFDQKDVIKTSIKTTKNGPYIPDDKYISVANCEQLENGDWIIKSEAFYLEGYKNPSHLEILSDQPIKWDGDGFRVGFLYNSKHNKKIYATEILLMYHKKQ